MINIKKTLSFVAVLLLLGTIMVIASQTRALTYQELTRSGQVMGETNYRPVKLTSSSNQSLTVTATPQSFENGKWTYKFDWVRTRNVKGSIYITLKSNKSVKILKLDTAAKSGSQTAQLDPLTAYRFEFYSQVSGKGTVLLRKFFTTMEMPVIDAFDPLPPDPVDLPAPANASNTVTITDKSGQAQTNYPVQIGRPFKQGEIKDYPGVSVDGKGVLTQADVKNRWSDGSVKFAILSFILPSLPANGSVTLTFSNQTTGNNTPLSKEAMLGANFNFDAQIKLASNGSTKTVSAREMLNAGDYTVWTSGPVATTIILADHSTERKYDMGFDSYKSFRPVFEAVFWPATKQVRVRYIGENSNTKTLQDIKYDLSLTLGQSSPQTVYSRTNLVHLMMTRWTKTFWLNQTPEQKINIDNNLAYLEQTNFFPAYDTSVKVPETAIADSYSRWLKTPRDLYESGGWTKYMPTTGGRADIGPFTTWTARWLYTGDWRDREVALGMADLAGSWRLNVREGNADKKIDKSQTVSGLGLPISIYAYPNLWLPDNNGSYKQLALSDPTIVTNASEYPTHSYGWVSDSAHQPDPFFAQYVLTGDHWYLEEIQMWASASAVTICSGSATWCRGPNMAAIYEQVRGEAWMLRGRVYAAYLTPDSSPVLKGFYTQLVNDAIAFWEGKYGITGTPFQNTAEWKWANANVLVNPNPLHFWALGSTPPWAHYFLLIMLGMAKEKGFAVGPVLNFASSVLTKQVTAANYNPYNIASYAIIVQDESGVPYSSWEQVQTANVALGNMKSSGNFAVTGSGAYYSIVATAASSYLTGLPDGLTTWNFLRKNVKEAALKNDPSVPNWYKAFFDGSGEIDWNIIPRQ